MNCRRGCQLATDGGGESPKEDELAPGAPDHGMGQCQELAVVLGSYPTSGMNGIPVKDSGAIHCKLHYVSAPQ